MFEVLYNPFLSLFFSFFFLKLLDTNLEASNKLNAHLSQMTF